MSKAAMQVVNFLDYDDYSSGGGIPNGRYVMFFDPMDFAPEPRAGQKRTEPRLGVMVTAYNPEAKDDIHTQFLGFGKGFNKCYTINPDTGKGLVVIPGQTPLPFPASSNWGYFLKSMKDNGLGKGVATNDLSVFDGLWADVAQVPEPEDRKGFRNNSKSMSEAEDEPEIKGSGKILQIVQFVEGGVPWEGGGGLPEGFPPHVVGAGQKKKDAPATPAKPAAPAGRTAPSPKAAAAPARPGPAKPNGSAKPGPARPAAPATPAATGLDELEVREAAVNGIAAVLGQPANTNGLFQVKLRTGAFQAVSKAVSAEMGQAVLDTFFGSAEALNGVLGDLGYVTDGTNVSVAEAA